MGRRALVIGLDGASLDLVVRWATAGRLPALGRLLAAGAHGLLRSVPNTSPGWATFATGVNPARHGIFHAYSWSEDRRTLRRMCGADCRAVTLWRMASDAGRRVVVVNVPFTYPAEAINGVLVAGSDAPQVSAPAFCYPPDFLARFRDYRVTGAMQAAILEGRPERGLAEVAAVVQRQTDVFLGALARVDWDLGVVVYGVPDVVQHFFWSQMTRDGPQRDAILDAYRLADRQIERILASVDGQAYVFVVSDHGFGPICATRAHLAAWLTDQGFMQTLPPGARTWPARLAGAAYGRLRRGLSETQKDRLRRWFPGLRDRVETLVRFGDIKWPATRAYVGPSPFEIWINSLGREPQGVVAPGAPYDAVCAEIKTALLAWRDPATGRPRVRAVHGRKEVYAGPYLQAAPDITIAWSPEAAPNPTSLEGNTSRFDGDHQPEGLLIVTGPQMRAGAVIPAANLADLAPTILGLLGIAPSTPFDGRVLPAVYPACGEGA